MKIEVGDFWTVGAQEYVCVEVEPYTRVDGTPSELAVLRTRCATCGDVVNLKATVHFKDGESPQFSRRCQECKKPGMRIGKDARITYRGKIL